MHVLGTRVPRRLGVASSASSPKAAQALGCSLTPSLRISFWPGHLHGTGCLSVWAVGTGFPTVVRRLCLGPGCGWVWVLLTPPVLAGVLGGCVWARFVVLSLFCRLFVVFVVGLRFLLMGRVWFRARPACPPAGSGSGVRCGRACWARFPAVPRPSWLGCRGVFFAPFFLLDGVGCCLSLSRALWSVPPSPFFRAGLLAFFFVVCVCMFRCPFSRSAGVPGLVLPVLTGWSPCASLGVLSSVPSGWGVWPPLVVLAGGLVAVGCFRAPPRPPPVFCFGGGPACSSLCLPWAGPRTGPHSVWSSGLLLAVVFCLAVFRPGGSSGLCTRWARRPSLPGYVLALPAGRLRQAAACGSGLGGWGCSCPFSSAVPVLTFWLVRHRCCRARGGPVCGLWSRCVACWCGAFRGVRWLASVSPSR